MGGLSVPIRLAPTSFSCADATPVCIDCDGYFEVPRIVGIAGGLPRIRVGNPDPGQTVRVAVSPRRTEIADRTAFNLPYDAN